MKLPAWTAVISHQSGNWGNTQIPPWLRRGSSRNVSPGCTRKTDTGRESSLACRCFPISPLDHHLKELSHRLLPRQVALLHPLITAPLQLRCHGSCLRDARAETDEEPGDLFVFSHACKSRSVSGPPGLSESPRDNSKPKSVTSANPTYPPAGTEAVDRSSPIFLAP